MPSLDRLRRIDWEVFTVPLATCQEATARWHYSGGGSNTATYRHGLFRRGDPLRCWGIAWWIPPTKSAAIATFPADWRKVLSLSRLAIDPEAPRNAASFLLSRSVALIDRGRWPCLVTYADEWRGHTGAIYRACNWEYKGRTRPERTYVIGDRLVSRKAGPSTRTHAEMIALGANLVGAFAKHKFVHIYSPCPGTGTCEECYG